MNGREIFKKYNKIIDFLEKKYQYIPTPFKKVSYTLFPNEKVRILLRYFNLKSASNNIGQNIYIASNVIIKNSQKLALGNNFSLHEFSYLDAIGGITIGNNVSIAHNCSLVSFEHTWNNNKVSIKYNPTINQEIIIGNDVWIGCGVRILSGAVIGNRVVVAAGAVVKGSLESGYLYGGVPARKLKKL